MVGQVSTSVLSQSKRMARGGAAGLEAVGGLGLIFVAAQFVLLLALQAELGGPGIDRPCLGAGDAQALGHRAVVEDLDDDGSEPGLLQAGGSGAAGDFDSRLGIERNDKQHVRIEQLLQLAGIASPSRGGELRHSLGWQRRSQAGECVQEPCHVGGQRLALHRNDLRLGATYCADDDQDRYQKPKRQRAPHECTCTKCPESGTGQNR